MAIRTGRTRRPAAHRRGLHYYQDRKRAWRWRLYGRNGKLITTSGEGNGFVTKAAAVKNWKATVAAVHAIKWKVWPTFFDSM